VHTWSSFRFGRRGPYNPPHPDAGPDALIALARNADNIVPLTPKDRSGVSAGGIERAAAFIGAEAQLRRPPCSPVSRGGSSLG